jgi:flagellar biosynthesis/type III secretory pathway chaperone
MSALKTAIDQARGEAQGLHRRVDATTAKNHAAIRSDLESVRGEAKNLAATLKTLSQSQLADARQHLIDAYESIHEFDQATMDLESATYEDLKEKNRTALHHLRSAISSLGRAVVAQRATVSRN